MEELRPPNKLTSLNKRFFGKLGVMLGTRGINGEASFIRKKFDKTTCNSRLTGKRGLKAYDAGYLKPREVGKFFNKLRGFTYRCLQEVGMTMKKGVVLPTFKLTCLCISTARFSCRNRAVRPIQKINEKSTCNSRLTGKRGLRSFRGIFWCFFTVKNCIKKWWKFAYRFLRKVEMTTGHQVEMARGKSLASYVLYLATIKILFRVCLAHARRWGLGTPAATGVALEIVPPLQIRKRKAIPLKRSALSFSLIMVLFCVCLAHARQQGLGTPVATGVALSTDSIKPLQIGDSIPDALWNIPLQMVKAGQEGSTTVTLDDYKGKLIILDFWATWCGSCIAAFPKIKQLQLDFSAHMQTIPVTYQPKDKISAFFHNNPNAKDLAGSIVQDSVISRYFPHRLIPHYVWIYNGRVEAITDGFELTSKNIQALITQERKIVRVKSDLDFDRSKPFDANAAIGIENLTLYRSIFAKYINGVGSSFGITSHKDGKQKRLYIVNGKILDFYNFAVDNPNRRRIVLEVKDTSRYLAEPEVLATPAWAKANLFCYELIFPADLNDKRLRTLVLNDINRYLGLHGRMERRNVDCYVIQSDPALSSNSLGNPSDKEEIALTIDQLINRFSFQLAGFPTKPILISDVENDRLLSLTANSIETLTALKAALRPYGLKIIKDQRVLEVFVITELDSGQNE
jgi:thiol-disulfide isomerase/thioredoxin